MLNSKDVWLGLKPKTPVPMSKPFRDNYDSVNWGKSDDKNFDKAFYPIPILQPPTSFIAQIAQEKAQAVEGSYTSITALIPLLYELQGLLAWLTKCPAGDRREVIDFIRERQQEIIVEINTLDNNINLIKVP